MQRHKVRRLYQEEGAIYDVWAVDIEAHYHFKRTFIGNGVLDWN